MGLNKTEGAIGLGEGTEMTWNYLNIKKSQEVDFMKMVRWNFKPSELAAEVCIPPESISWEYETLLHSSGTADVRELFFTKRWVEHYTTKVVIITTFSLTELHV